MTEKQRYITKISTITFFDGVLSFCKRTNGKTTEYHHRAGTRYIKYRLEGEQNWKEKNLAMDMEAEDLQQIKHITPSNAHVIAEIIAKSISHYNTGNSKVA